MPGLLAAKWLSRVHLPSNQQSGRDRDGCVVTVHMEAEDMGTESGLRIPPSPLEFLKVDSGRNRAWRSVGPSN